MYSKLKGCVIVLKCLLLCLPRVPFDTSIFQQVADLLEARAVDGRGEPVPYLQAVFKGK